MSMKCWLVSTDEFWMLSHGETRSRAVASFLGQYTDNSFDEYARGWINIRTRRIPELDGHVDVDVEYKVLLKRGLEIWCPRCEYENMVAGPKELWERDTNVDVWEEDWYRLAYEVDDQIMCSGCAERREGEKTLISIDPKLVKSRE